MNPVTFHGKRTNGEPVAMTIGRVHIKIGSEMQKLVNVTFWKGEDREPTILGAVDMDEDYFLGGLEELGLRVVPEGR